MATLGLTTDGFSLEVTSAQPISAGEGSLRQLVAQLQALHLAVPLTSLMLEQTLADPTKFTLVVTPQDGRAPWNSTFDVQPTFTRESFNLAAFWRLEELTPVRPLRQSLVNLIRTFEVIKVEAKWEP